MSILVGRQLFVTFLVLGVSATWRLVSLFSIHLGMFVMLPYISTDYSLFCTFHFNLSLHDV